MATEAKPTGQIRAARPPEAPSREEVRAEARWIRISPRKARLVCDHIRGRSVPEARTVLAFTQRAAAREIEKVLKSAVSNAEANHGMFGDDLLVSAVYVDEGPTIKRWRARARGRASRIYKRTCHITVRLAPAEQSGSGRSKRAQQGTRKAEVPTATKPRAAKAPAEKPKASRRKKKEEAEG